MAWPVVSIIVKVISIKFAKATFVGLVRYCLRIIGKKPLDEKGNILQGKQRINHVIQNEFAAKDNQIFLLLMVGNLFFGLQELLLWLWSLLAKIVYTEFNTGIPSGLEDPEKLCERLHSKPWIEIYPELFRWLAIASLISWPSLSEGEIIASAVKNKKWIELRYKRSTYLINISKERRVVLVDLLIDIDIAGNIRITSRDQSSTAIEKMFNVYDLQNSGLQ